MLGTELGRLADPSARAQGPAGDPAICPQSGNKLSLRTTALENTSIKVGPARKNVAKGRMARRSKRSRRRETQDR